MQRFILQRLLNLLPIAIGVTFFSFLIISLTPGDFLSSMSLNPQISPARITKLRHDFGLDQPWYIQYGLWLYRLSPVGAQGLKTPDLGYSFSNKTSVFDLLSNRFGNTLLLSFSAELFIWLIAIPLGILAAAKHNSLLDRFASFGVFFGISLPEILLALLALLFAANTGWFPIGGMHSLNYEELSFSGRISDVLHHLILPTLVLGITGAAALMRYMRSSLLDVLSADYLRTARAKGLTNKSAILRHGVRNAMNPMITLFGISFANLISSSFLVEVIMGWPGIGKLTYEAILAKDLYVIMATLIVATFFLITGNLFADILLAANDPRIRYE